MQKNEIEKTNKELKSKEPNRVILKKAAQLFEGPIPPPQILKGYKDIDDSFPDRILKMAEKDLQTRHNMNYLGWFGTYSLSLILIGGGIYLVANDKPGDLAFLCEYIVEALASKGVCLRLSLYLVAIKPLLLSLLLPPCRTPKNAPLKKSVLFLAIFTRTPCLF